MYSCGGFPRIYSQNFYCKEWTTTVVNLPSKLVFQQNLVLAGSSWWAHLLPNVCSVLWNVNILESNNLFNIGDCPKCDGICNLVASTWCKRQQCKRNYVLPGARQGLQVRTSMIGCFLDLPYFLTFQIPHVWQPWHQQMWQQEKSNCAKLWGHIFQFDCIVWCVLQMKIILVQYWPCNTSPHFFSQSRSQKLVQVLIAASNGDRMALER